MGMSFAHDNNDKLFTAHFCGNGHKTVGEAEAGASLWMAAHGVKGGVKWLGNKSKDGLDVISVWRKLSQWHLDIWVNEDKAPPFG